MELLRRMRQKSDLPVIFLTSKDDEIDELFGLKMGADDFIRKPFSQRLLVERVRAVLRRASAREADRIEQQDLDFFERVRAGYAARAAQAPHRIVRVDASGTVEQVGAQVLAVLEQRYPTC